MLDIRRIRTDPAEVKAALARRGIDVADVDRVHDLDTRRRELAAERDEVRNRVKTVSKEVGRLRGAGDVAAAEAQQAESRALGERERALADDEAAVAEEIRQLLLRIPNTPHPDAPDGASDADNPVVKVVGFDPESYQPHQRVPHWETGAALGILDNERAVKITGSMFVMLRKQGATLSRALCQLALDNNADAFEEIRPPSLVSSATLTATGQLPKFADDAYAIERDDLWCIPTAEVPLTSIASGELLDEADLPQRFMAYSPCYRREAGSAGRDTRGMLRAHEFDKVEILAYATPAEAPALLEELVARAEATIASLGLAYRVIEICTADLGQSHHRSFDIEVYAPGCD
ncbi:MAG TPA: aminoacyl--tRNA ligase-related protein, partial [Acidimicrobiales bacterium]